MNPDFAFGSVKWNDIVLWLLAFGGAVFVADAIGILPARFARWVARNRFDGTLNALKRLGVRVCWDDEQQKLGELLLSKLHIEEPSYKRHLNEMLASDRYEGQFQVGERQHFESDGFVDVMGSLARPGTATQYARLLNNFRVDQNLTDFDIVATPKSGSPLLGYEFSKLVNKPLVLGCAPKVIGPRGSLGAHVSLDFPKDLELKDKRVLLVDDSTTGGRKMTDLATDLRDSGAIVEHALVLFEPRGKKARESLTNVNIKLHAIAPGPNGKF